MTITNDLANSLLSHVYRQSEYPSPDQIEAGLLDSSMVELIGAGYSRVNINGKFSTPSEGVLLNSSDIVFPSASEVWLDILYLGIYHGSSLLHLIRFPSGISVPSGLSLRLQPGKLIIAFGSMPDGYYVGGWITPVPDGYWLDNEVGPVPDGYWLDNEVGPVPDGYWLDNEVGPVPDGYWLDNEVGPVPDGVWQDGTLQGPCVDPDSLMARFVGVVHWNSILTDYENPIQGTGGFGQVGTIL
jgi:hypothetical protein